MPHNKFKYWDKGFWVWQGDSFWFFFQTFIYLTLIFFYMCVYTKNTSHISQQPINAVDTGNLSVHIPHALGSGGEQSLPVTKGHFRIFASIPRSFSNFLVQIHDCEEKSQELSDLGWPFFWETRKLFNVLSWQSSGQQQNAACLDEQRRSWCDMRTSNVWVFDEICYRNPLFTMFEGPEELLE